MPKRFALDPALQLDELASYHQDVEASLRLYFSPSNPKWVERFVGKRLDDVNRELKLRLEESDVRSAFFVLTSLEAGFRLDFDLRCQRRWKDPLSVHFREVEREREDKVRLDEDILEGWRRHWSASSNDIGELRRAFKFRHWVAHGRYWTPKLGRKYAFPYVRLIAEGIFSGFPFAV
jgi:hypothetical protein